MKPKLLPLTLSLLVFHLLVPVDLDAQNYTRRQEFSVMNPNTYEISRFELTPINQYTGKANASFPLFSMDLDGKEISFSLSYDTGGVRVAQEATWVGLGWNLNGIPVITHQINQKSDIGNKLHPTTGYCFEPELPQGAMTENYWDWLTFGDYYGPYYQPDTQPDVFVANLIGSTVKFQLTQRETTGGVVRAYILNESNARINYSEDDQNFNIVDEDGFVYYFTQKEYTTSWSEEGGSFDTDYPPSDIKGWAAQYNDEWERWIPSAWYVDRIVSPDGEVLEFRYDDEEDDKPNVTVSHPQYHSSIKVSICGYDKNDGNIANDFEPNPIFENIMATRTIQENKILKEIENASTGEKIVFTTQKRFDLQEFTPNHWGVSPYGINSTDGIPKRLSAIDLISSTGKTVKNISFQQSYFNSYKKGAEDAVDYLRLKLDGFKIQDQQYAFKYKCYDALPKKHSKATDFWGFYNGQNNQWRVPYVTFNADNCQLESPELINQNTELQQGAIKGSNLEHTQIGSLQEIRHPTGGTTRFEYELNDISLDISGGELTPDHFNFPYLEQHNIAQDYPRSGLQNPNHKTYAVGGLRIKSVTNNDAQGNALLRKSYNYQETTQYGDLVSSGKLMDALHFFQSQIELFQNSNVVLSNLIINSGNIFGTNGSAMGSHIGYSRVEEFIESNTGESTIGKIVSYFINVANKSLAEEGNGIKYAVQSTPVNYEDANGKLMEQQIFDRENNLKQHSLTTYGVRNGGNTIYGHKIFYSTIGQVYFTYSYPYDFYHYPISRYFVQPDQTVTTEFLDNNQQITNTVHFGYNERHRLLYTEKSEDGQSLSSTSYFYPYSFGFEVNELPQMQELNNRNQIGRPVYFRNYIKGQLVSHKLTKYQNTNGRIKPEGIYFEKEEAHVEQMENRVKYERYDANGNLCQYKENAGPTISAIWGYDGQYIVAKIENASYDQIEALPYFGQNFDLGKNGLSKDQKSTLRDKLKQAHITFYTHKPAVGPIQISDPSGRETNYQYDTYNRLIAIRDENNNVLKDFQYHFVDVSLYPIGGLSDCYDPLVANVSVSDNTQQYINLTANASGGVGDYEYAWYLSQETIENPNQQFPKEIEFNGFPSSTTSTFNWIICCNSRRMVKLVVHSGFQEKTVILQNPNYDPNCDSETCNNHY